MNSNVLILFNQLAPSSSIQTTLDITEYAVVRVVHLAREKVRGDLLIYKTNIKTVIFKLVFVLRNNDHLVWNTGYILMSNIKLYIIKYDHKRTGPVHFWGRMGRTQCLVRFARILNLLRICFYIYILVSD